MVGGKDLRSLLPLKYLSAVPWLHLLTVHKFNITWVVEVFMMEDVFICLLLTMLRFFFEKNLEENICDW